MNGRFSRLEVEKQSTETEAVLSPVALGNVIRTAESDMGSAAEAFHSGQFESALQMYTKALGKQQSLLPAWVGQVQMLVELSEYTEARLWSDKALELFRNNGELLAAKARACLYQGDQTAASQCSDASLESPGCSPLRWQARGELQLSRGQPRARDCFDKALADPAADWFDRIIVARAYLRFRKGTPALECAQAALILRPGHAYCWYVLGECQESVGWLGQAAVSYARASDLSHNLPAAKSAMKRLANESWTGRLGRRFGGLFKR